MKNPTQVILQILFKILLRSVYGLTVNVKFKMHNNSCCRNIYLYDDLWGMILLQFDILSYNFSLSLISFNIVNVVLHSHK